MARTGAAAVRVRVVISESNDDGDCYCLAEKTEGIVGEKAERPRNCFRRGESAAASKGVEREGIDRDGVFAELDCVK